VSRTAIAKSKRHRAHYEKTWCHPRNRKYKKNRAMTPDNMYRKFRDVWTLDYGFWYMQGVRQTYKHTYAMRSYWNVQKWQWNHDSFLIATKKVWEREVSRRHRRWGKGNGKERKSIYIAPFWTKVHTKRSGMDHTVLPANNTMPAFPSCMEYSAGWVSCLYWEECRRGFCGRGFPSRKFFKKISIWKWRVLMYSGAVL